MDLVCQMFVHWEIDLEDQLGKPQDKDELILTWTKRKTSLILGYTCLKRQTLSLL